MDYILNKWNNYVDIVVFPSSCVDNNPLFVCHYNDRTHYGVYAWYIMVRHIIVEKVNGHAHHSHLGVHALDM